MWALVYIYIYKNELSLPFHNFLSRRSPPNAFNFIFYLFRACSCFGLRRRARFLKPTIWSRGCQNYFIIKHPYPARSNLHNYYFTDFHARENELWKKFMGLCTFSKEKLISFVLKQAHRAGSTYNDLNAYFYASKFCNKCALQSAGKCLAEQSFSSPSPAGKRFHGPTTRKAETCLSKNFQVGCSWGWETAV